MWPAQSMAQQSAPHRLPAAQWVVVSPALYAASDSYLRLEYTEPLVAWA